jgi:hypothetical protein
MNNRGNVRPGDAVQIIIRSDNADHVLKGTVYEVDGKKILLSQTSPPLSRSHRGLHARISFSARSKGGSEQRAFIASIADFLPGYRISSSQTVPAVILEQKTGPQLFNRRMAVRVKPTLNSGLTAMFEANRMTILDISLTGAKLSGQKPLGVEKGAPVSIRFIFDSKWFDVDANVVRMEFRAGLHYMSVQFAPDQNEFEHHLGKKLLMIQREHLARQL